MKHVKKLMVMIAVVATIAASTTAITANASAEDFNIDRFTIKATSYTQVGAPREKEDKTSVYCYIKKAGNSVKAQTWGSENAKLKKNLTCNRNGKLTSFVKLSIGTEYQIYNKIKETGYGYAGLKLKSNNSINSDIVSGAWSADSVGTAYMPVANN